MAKRAAEPGNPGAQLSQVQDVLKSIFAYYNGASGCSSSSMSYQALGEPLLTSMRFQRMALDANLTDERLTSAKVDLIFHKVCGVSPHMNLSQFLDAIVRIAATKYPGLPRNEGVLRLHGDHLATFSGASEGVFGDLDDEMLGIAGAARAPLQVLYEGYFDSECRQTVQRNATAVQSEKQSAFVKMLTDFEVLPELVPKSMAFSVFREVARARELPEPLREALAGDAPDPPPGRHFTYLHFAVAVMLVARRCFADDGARALVRLLEWMDASKGRLVFAALHPGHIKCATSSFRLLPERAAALAAERRAAEASRRRGGGAGPTAGRPVQRAPSRGAAAAYADTPSEAGDAAECTLDEGRLEQPLRAEDRRLIQQIFGHYAAIGDPLNRTALSTTKFLRFLRDCGLVSSETSAPSKDFQFSPGERMRRSGSTGQIGHDAPGNASSFGPRSGSVTSLTRRSAGGLGRRGTTQSVQGGPRESLANATGRSSQVFTVSPSKSRGTLSNGGSDSGLPLRVFPVPLISQVEADLIFVAATRAEAARGTPNPGVAAPRRNSGAGISAKRGSVTAKKRSHLAIDGFLHSLQDVSLRCYPATPEDSLENFCDRVLLPLSETLLEVKGQEVSFAAEVLMDPETVKLFERCQPGLDKIYTHYAHENAGRKAHWNSEGMTRFAEDFDLLSEVNQLPMQKVFRDCTHYESLVGRGVDGEMSFSSFQLALVMIAQKVHVGSQQALRPLDRVMSLFGRLNTIAGSSGAGSAWKASDAPLIPGLPAPGGLSPASAAGVPGRRLSSAQQHGSSVPAGSRSERQRASAADLSWAAMLEGAGA